MAAKSWLGCGCRAQSPSAATNTALAPSHAGTAILTPFPFFLLHKNYTRASSLQHLPPVADLSLISTTYDTETPSRQDLEI